MIQEKPLRPWETFLENHPEKMFCSKSLTIFQMTKVLNDLLIPLYKDHPDYVHISWSEAKELCFHILKIDGLEWLTQGKRFLTTQEKKNFHALMLQRFRKRKPLNKIQEKTCFWKDFFLMNKHTLAPRLETEGLISVILKHFKGLKKNPDTILDLGTGSGCIILSLLKEFPESLGAGLDISPKALEIAKKNAQNLNISSVFWVQDSFETLLAKQSHFFSTQHVGKISCIVSNPPYITTQEMNNLPEEVKVWDPHIALHGGPQGINFYHQIIPFGAQNLEKNGIFALEIGYDQEHLLVPLMDDYFSHTAVEKDLRGISRYLIGKHEE